MISVVAGTGRIIVPYQSAGKFPVTFDLSGGLIRHQLGDEFEDQPMFQIPWRHHVEIFTKCKTIDEAVFSVNKTVENGWSRATLTLAKK